MFLKTLTMKGFKSFADPVYLEFEPGITVIVGPNGSGKSNIVDAVAWVLGAQSPRSIRSSRMEDVIFAGTDSRSPLGRAEVSLTIDNRSRRLPVDIAEVTITRTLFRSGESEYALNGAPCRLLDVQELLSDTGVGRQQHIIVSQGQLEGVLNSHPEERRLVIEEAAGVLKFRRRRERAERRLDATEGNLQRLADMVREVKRQLRPLERQAAAARAHGQMAGELLALRRHLAGRDLGELRRRSRESAERMEDAQATQRRVAAESVQMDTEIARMETTLSAGRDDDLGEWVRRVEGLRGRAQGLAAVLAERARSLTTALDAAVDRDVVATLEAEAAGLSAEIESTDAEREELARQAEEIRQAEVAVAGRREAHAAALGAREKEAGMERVDHAAAEARARLESLGHAVDHGSSAIDLLDSRLAATDRRGSELGSSIEKLRAEMALAEKAIVLAERVSEVAEVSLANAVAEAERADAALASAEAEYHTWAARADALAAALAERLDTEGTALLTGSPDAAGALGGRVLGAVGTLVEVDSGWAHAFEVAVGAALTGVVMEDAPAARRALGLLREHAAAGSVMPLGLGACPAPEDPLPEGVRLLRDLVRPRPGIAREEEVAALLDRLLQRSVAFDGDWTEALELATVRPDLAVVTREGDRFAADGWRAKAGESRVSPAGLAEAHEAAEAAGVAVGDGREQRARARSRLDVARLSVTESRRAVDVAFARRTGATAALARLEEELERLSGELVEGRERRDELVDQVQRDESLVAEIGQRLPELELAAQEEEAARRGREEERRAIEADAAATGARRAGFDAAQRALDDRRALLARRLAEVERRLTGHAMERAQASDRRRQIERGILAVASLATVVDQRRGDLGELASLLDRRRRAQLDALRAGDARLGRLRRERALAQERLSASRQQVQDLEIARTEVRLRIEALVEMVERDLECTAEAAVLTACPELPEGVAAQTRMDQLESELSAIGPVNPLALQELGELEERAGFLDAQVADVKEARRELHRVIRSVDEEIVSAFASAYADVDFHFGELVGTLFPGGSGRLLLTEPDRLLETGVEVEVRVAGRGHRKMSLLSGGERSLVALAFLFAVFQSRPSPFYLLDEVEAALDDINLHRFLSLIAEFRDEAQLLIVSHQKLTMESADALYGVTASPGSSSKVISERLRTGV